MVSGGMGTTRLALGLSVILLCLAGSLLADVAPSRVDAGDQTERSRRPIFRRDTCPGDPGDGKQCNSTSLQRSLTRADKDYDSGTYVGNNSMCLKLMKDEERHGTALLSVKDQSISIRRERRSLSRDTRAKARSVDRRTKRDTDRRFSLTDHTQRTSSQVQTRRMTVQADRRRETEDPSTRRSHRTADGRARSPDRTSAAERRDVSSQERTRQSSRRVYSPERRATLQDESSSVNRRQERRVSGPNSIRSSRNERRAATLERRSASLDSIRNQRASRTAEDRTRSAERISAAERRDLSVQERTRQSSNRVFSAHRRSSSREESSRFNRRVERRVSESDAIKYQPSSRTERRVVTSERRSTSLDSVRNQRVSRTAEDRARSLVEVRRNSVTERRESSRRINSIERRATPQDDSSRVDRRVERRVSGPYSIRSSRTERRVVLSVSRSQSPDTVRNQRASRTAEDRSHVEARRTPVMERRDSSRRVLPQDESSRVERRVERRISGSDTIKSQLSSRTDRREVTSERRMQSPVSVRNERASRTTRSLDRNSVTERRDVSTQERVRQSSRRVYSSERRASTQDESSRVERRVKRRVSGPDSIRSSRIERNVVASERRSASLDSVRNQRTSRTAEDRARSPVEVRRTSVTERRDVSAQERNRKLSRRAYFPESRVSPQDESTRVDRRVERRVSGPDSERRSASLDSVRNQRASRIERSVSFVERRTERRSVSDSTTRSSDSTTERSRQSARVDAARTRVERRATYAERRDQDYRAERRIRSMAEETRTQRRITSGERRSRTDRLLSLSPERTRSTAETARTRQAVRSDEDRRIVGLRKSRVDVARIRETSRTLRKASAVEQRTTTPTQTERNIARRSFSRDTRTSEAAINRLSSRRTPERTDSARTREQSRADRRVTLGDRRLETTRMDQSSNSNRRLKRSVSLGDERTVESLSRSYLTRRLKGGSVRREDLRTSIQRREDGLDRRAARRSSLDSSRRSVEEAVSYRRAEARERSSDTRRRFSETRRTSDQHTAQSELVRVSDSTRQIRRILSDADKSQRRVDGYDTLDRRSLRASRSVSQDRRNARETERAASRESLYRRMVNILPQDRRVRETRDVRRHSAENLQRRTITEARRLVADRREISSRRTPLMKLSFNGLETEERRLQAASKRARETAADRRETSLGVRTERQTTDMRRRSLTLARTKSERRADDLSTVGLAGAWRRDARQERRSSEATRHADMRKSMSEARESVRSSRGRVDAVRSSSLDRQSSLERRSRKSLDGLTRLEHRRDSSSDRTRRSTSSERNLHTTTARRTVDVREDARIVRDHVTRASDTIRRSAPVDALERMKISVKRSESWMRMSDKSHRLEESVRSADNRRASRSHTRVDLAPTTIKVKTEDNQLPVPALASLELKDNHVPDNYLSYVLAAMLIGATIFYDSLVNSSLQASLPDFDLPQPAMEEASSKGGYKELELAGKRGSGGPLRTILAGVASLRLF